MGLLLLHDRLLTHTGELEVDSEDAVVGGLVVVGHEGRGAHQELVHEHAQAPHVHPLVVLLVLQQGQTSASQVPDTLADGSSVGYGHCMQSRPPYLPTAIISGGR